MKILVKPNQFLFIVFCMNDGYKHFMFFFNNCNFVKSFYYIGYVELNNSIAMENIKRQLSTNITYRTNQSRKYN